MAAGWAGKRGAGAAGRAPESLRPQPVLLHSPWAAVDDVILVREWDADSFHRRVLELESQGYTSRRDTYCIIPEMDPETGNIIHLHTIEMSRTSS